MPIGADRPGKGRRSLMNGIICEFVTVSCRSRIKSREPCLCSGGSPHFEHSAMKIISAAPGNDVDHTPCRCAVFGRECILKYCHFLHGSQRNAGKNGLSPPTVIARAAINLKPSLPAARAMTVGGDRPFLPAFLWLPCRK